MRIFITLLCGGAIALCPFESRAEEATLTIRANIISYADWQDRLDGEPVIVARLNKQTNRRTHPREPQSSHLAKDTNENSHINDYIDSLDRTAYFRDRDIGSQAKFMVMDMNNDNVITRREYLISTGTPVTDSDFDQHDLDGDGFLSRFEVNHSLFSKNYMTSN